MSVNKKFMDLQVGDKFVHGGIEYVKIPDERVSCCHVNNSQQLNDPNTKIQVTPITEVQVSE
jgi:hypothetical protein